MEKSKTFNLLFLSILFVLVSCSQEPLGIINFRDKIILQSDYEMPYKSGNWDHPYTMYTIFHIAQQADTALN